MAPFKPDSEEDRPYLNSERFTTHKRYLPSLYSKEVVIVQWMIIVTLIIVTISGLNDNQCDKRLCLPSDRIWSPAEDAIKYQNIRFHPGADAEKTEYQGLPSPQVDEAWKDLYRYGISKISKAQAQQMHNKTVPIPGELESYIVGLDVFHQLHCLNMLRKRLWLTNKGLAQEDEDEVEHVEHCTESIRQYIMCNADVSPIVWRWNSETNTSRPISTIYHTCRDFDALHRWSKEHALDSFDPYTYVENDL